jgi:hypothetical protein
MTSPNWDFSHLQKEIKMKKLIIMLAMALVAFAIPATASATQTHFFDTADPSKYPFDVALTGTALYEISVAKTEGVHCPVIHFTIRIDGPTMGEVTGFDTTTECKTTSADPKKAGLIVHAHKIGTWTVTPDNATDVIKITGVHINNTVTAGGVVVAESTLKAGTITATIPAGETAVIKTVTLSSDGTTVEQGVPPAPPALGISITGHLTSNGTLGVKAP